MHPFHGINDCFNTNQFSMISLSANLYYIFQKDMKIVVITNIILRDKARFQQLHTFQVSSHCLLSLRSTVKNARSNETASEILIKWATMAKMISEWGIRRRHSGSSSISIVKDNKGKAPTQIWIVLRWYFVRQSMPVQLTRRRWRNVMPTYFFAEIPVGLMQSRPPSYR